MARAATRGATAPRGAIAVGLWALAGCAQLLDIPSDARLAQPVTPAAQQSAASEAGQSSAAQSPANAGSTPEAPGSVTPSAPTSGAAGAGGGFGMGGAAGAGATPDAGGAPVASPLDASVTPSCPAPQRRGPDDRCYATVATLLSWPNARNSCRQLGEGWELASIRSEALNQFLALLLTSETWIGGTDLDTEGSWRWLDDGSEFWVGSADAGSVANGAYANWNVAEPNDLNDSDCARILPDAAGAWADLQCNALRSAVCAGPPR